MLLFIIAGLQKTTLIDFPQKIAAIVFTQGCNFCCGYCHNPEILDFTSKSDFSTEKFFTDNNLKNEFKCVDYDPTLKLALSRLNDFFQKNTDKIKVFKEFDLDRNGKLSYEEFITALNSFEDLNLNDNQKYKILNIIDIDKDGKIDIKEFIKFSNNIKNNVNENGEISSNIPLINKKINKDENDSDSKVLNGKSQIKNNLNYNKNMLKQNNNDFLNYIVILQENLLKDVPELTCDKVIAIEHPFLFQTKMVLNENRENAILRIGTVGLGTVGKGYDKLNEIGHFIKNNNLSDKMNLFHVGNLLGVAVDSEYVALPFNSSNMIPSSDFNSEIAKLDWLLFLYPADSYKLVASGAIFDAFKFGKPILAIKNDYFMHLSGLGDNFGFLVNNIEELKKQLECLPNINSDEYKKMSDNSRKMLSNFLPEVVAEQLRSQL